MSYSKSSMRTPLGRVRGLGSAKSGTEHFWMQRLTGVANLPLSLFVIGLIITTAGSNYAAVKATLGSPLVAIPLILFVISATWHMRIGMQVIIEDYVPQEGPKVALILANTFFSFAIGLGSVFAILKLSFGV
ncbi:succinate dehydrogenase, hydrophobic membrane anchor protein [Phreatobacter cathodiphilus]|uniref:Succinate dehydrogenase hydrophobic membrane anchor subunit n=1 Tax=Phreatobacter cathodiphilus TaxID=1868589 RepID=A0A2S0N6P7_9HYPH|nr:succinate dehydrogenase, hydrophobic membrane anchor protein [Phreatobacter cathodiphilus]AVO43828.1 succinate dehydrogenase, hydrophobic membrane anchor protein [Phreatobacter cathodiphilus]